ncbi:MAG TPA: DNA replication and repair protein RecF [Thermoanaerobaculia bacterium]|nr:DNA replication and repair protein RecF [Thermoanaerobaculia bacterium]
MILRSLGTRSFRNLRDASIEFHPSANIFVGDNGQGKTNLLEAVYLLATTRSFRTTRTARLARLGAPSLFVEGLVEDAQKIERRLSIGIAAESERRRELLVNGQKATLQQYLAHLPVFAYSAARLEIIRGGPEERRRFLDRGIASIRPAYVGELSRYTRALRQRNALLQSIAERKRSGKELVSWNRELVESAIPIASARDAYASELALEAKKIAAAHAYHLEDLEFIYRPSGFEDGISIESGVAALHALKGRESSAGFTLAGPHRDQLEILQKGQPAAEILSSGEVKMTVLFLKLGKVELYRRETDGEPLFLLDDIDAELDLSIIERLLAYLIGSIQLFTTSPKSSFPDRFSLGDHRRFRVEEGMITEASER